MRESYIKNVLYYIYKGVLQLKLVKKNQKNRFFCIEFFIFFTESFKKESIFRYFLTIKEKNYIRITYINNVKIQICYLNYNYFNKKRKKNHKKESNQTRNES